MQHEQYSANSNMQQFLIEAVAAMQKMMPDLEIMPEIMRAYGKLDRAAFLPDTQQQYAYQDQAGALRTETSEFFPSSTTRPSLVLMMLHVLRLTPQSGQKVAEVGTGSGEVAAILDNLGCDVHTIEYDPGLAERARQRLQRLGHTAIHTYVGDGAKGIPQAAPFDRILSTAASSSIMYHLRDQLTVDGLLLHPYGNFKQEDGLVHGRLALVPKNGEASLLPLKIHFVPLVSSKAGGWTRGLWTKDVIPSDSLKAKALQMIRQVLATRNKR
jgi:Protein-L-isoaspartate carboxylmethyltransferase